MEFKLHPELLTLGKIHDPRGNLTVIESEGKEVPFDVRRVYYLYDVPAGAERGGHSHRVCHEVLIAISGSFDVTLDDGNERRTFTLNRPFQALHIVPGIWRTLDNFSSGAVCLVLASDHYDENDYVREYDEFLDLKRNEDDKTRTCLSLATR